MKKDITSIFGPLFEPLLNGQVFMAVDSCRRGALDCTKEELRVHGQNGFYLEIAKAIEKAGKRVYLPSRDLCTVVLLEDAPLAIAHAISESQLVLADIGMPSIEAAKMIQSASSLSVPIVPFYRSGNKGAYFDKLSSSPLAVQFETNEQGVRDLLARVREHYSRSAA